MYPVSSKPPGGGESGFLFLGNHLALDFLNTKPKLEGNFVELLPDLPALLHWYEAAALLERRSVTHLQRFDKTVVGRKVHRAILELRESLRLAVEDWEHGKPISPAMSEHLNELMARHPMLLRMTSPINTELWFPAAHPSDLFAPLAYSAAKLFAEEDQSRVRRCDACVLHFLDTSKKGTRRWCSMEICGNRAKVAAFADRQRQSF